MRHLIIFLSIALLGNAGAAVIYVDADATAGGDGSSWASAFNYLQDALDQTVASQGDEVWIAEGTYFPDDGASVTDGDRAASFTLKDDVALYGGFVGTETDLAQRNWDVYPTILSGEIWAEQIYWSIHVTTVDNNSTFDGLTITKGNANGSETGQNVAAAVYGQGYVTADNCTFTDNNAEYGGVSNGGSWTVTDSTFSNNAATVDGGVAYYSTWTVTDSTFSNNTADGGGVSTGANWTVTDSTFSNNTAHSGGVSKDANWTVTDSTFSNNTAHSGGVQFSWNTSNWTTKNCIFSGNSSSGHGGVAYRIAQWTAVDCLFESNSAAWVGGVVFGAPPSSTSLNLTNCIFSGNSSGRFGGVVAFIDTLIATNCIFSGNSASETGGVSYGFGNWIATNCTFSGNSANEGSLNYHTPEEPLYGISTWKLFNNIIYNNGSDIFKNTTLYSTTGTTPMPNPSYAYNLIEGGTASLSNPDDGASYLSLDYILDADPLFVNASSPSGADNIWGTADDGLRLQAGSPAIGQGNTDFLPLDTLDVDDDGVTDEPVPLDLAGFLRIQDGSLDLGAYEYGNSAEQLFTLTTAAGTGGSISPAGTQNYSDGAPETLTASPSAGYFFDAWTGDASGSTNPLSVTLNQNRTITATFTADTNDNDGDGLTNYQEIVIYGSNPELEDSSGDELTDKEVVDAGFDPTVSYATITDLVPGMEDADGNGLSDAFEASPNAGSLNSLGFYDESAMIALNLPSPLLSLTGPGNQAELEFTIETSSDLRTWSVSERIQRTLSGGAGKYFVRLQTGAPYVQPTVLIYAHPQYGDILTDANGQVLYYFLYDSAGGNPVVNGSWPLATAAETPVADVDISATLDNSYYGNVSNGPYLTVDDLPVYTYVGDTEANQASGQGSGTVWYTIRPDGSLNKP